MLTLLRTLIALCLLATIVSTLSVYPHQLAYFNEAAGGPENGYKHLLHSNLDWGQDLLLARSRVKGLGASPRVVQVTSYFPYPLASLISSHGEASTPNWEILSSNNAVILYGPRLDQGTSGLMCRIGYTLWLRRLSDP